MNRDELPEGYYARDTEDGKVALGHIYLEDGAYKSHEEVYTKSDFDKLTERKLDNKFSDDPEAVVQVPEEEE